MTSMEPEQQKTTEKEEKVRKQVQQSDEKKKGKAKDMKRQKTLPLFAVGGEKLHILEWAQKMWKTKQMKSQACPGDC